MHEFSLAQGLFTQLQQLARENEAKKIVTVRIAVGKLSGIVIDSFSFGFEVLAGENDLTRDAVLEISEVDPEYKCLDCGAVNTHIDSGPDHCHQCDSQRLVPQGGDDLVLTQIEME